MKKFIDFLIKNDEPIGLKALKLEQKASKTAYVSKNPWETPIFVKYGDFYQSLKKIEEKH